MLLSPSHKKKSCNFLSCLFIFFSIEQCLRDLQSEVNELCVDEMLHSTTDCLQWLHNCSFSSLRPSATHHGDLMEFLRTLVKKNQLFTKDFNVCVSWLRAAGVVLVFEVN